MNRDDPEELSFAGAEMRALRAMANVSQPVWARLLRTSKQRISKYERNVYRTPAPLLQFARITADPLARAQWLKEIPKAE